MISDPLVTIITSVYNGENHLEQCIHSVISQDYKKIEYIVIDGGSTDNSCEIIKRNSQYIDYWVSEPDDGIYNAWNKGLKKANGDLIAFLGADDYYESYAISTMVKEWKKKPNVEYLCFKVKQIDTKGRQVRIVGKKWNWKDFSKFMNTAHVGSMHNKLLFELYGVFDESFRIAGDYEFLLRSKSKLKVKYIPHVLCTMRVGGASSSSFKIFKENAKAKRKHTNKSSLEIFFEEIIAGLKWIIKRTFQ
mgnify:CR=1 FL=1